MADAVRWRCQSCGRTWPVDSLADECCTEERAARLARNDAAPGGDDPAPLG